MNEGTYVCAAICRTCNDEELASAPYDADGDGHLDHETAGLVGGASRNHLARYPDHVIEFVADAADSDAIWREVVKVEQEAQHERAVERAVELTRQQEERRLAYESRFEDRTRSDEEQEARTTVARRQQRRRR